MPNNEVLVFWNDIDDEIILPIINYYSNTKFINIHEKISIDDHSISAYASSRKSGKMSFLKHVFEYLDYDSEIIIIDNDTLILKDLKIVFETSFDVAFTPLNKNVSAYPMNSGVLFLRKNDRTKKLIEFMDQHVIDLSKDNKKHEIAIKKYGGADQAAFCRIVDYESDGMIEKDKVLHDLKFNYLNADMYNNFKHVNDLSDIFVIHLKGTWQTLIFQGRPLSNISGGYLREMIYFKFLNYFIRSLKIVFSEKNAMNLPLERLLEVKIPIYIMLSNNHFKENKLLMYLYIPLERIYRFCVNRNLKLFQLLLHILIFRKYSKL